MSLGLSDEAEVFLATEHTQLRIHGFMKSNIIHTPLKSMFTLSHLLGVKYFEQRISYVTNATGNVVWQQSAKQSCLPITKRQAQQPLPSPPKCHDDVIFSKIVWRCP